MPGSDLTRYFFHIRDGVFIEDLDGMVLPDPDAARNYAILSAREMCAMR